MANNIELTNDDLTSERDRLWLILHGISPQMWSHEIRSEPMQLGRAQSSDIILEDTKVSRTHATIQKQGLLVLLKDCKSRNGVFIQGNKTTEAALPIGTRFRVGDMDLTIADQEMLSQDLESFFGKSTRIDNAPESARATLRAFTEQRQRILNKLSSAEKRVLKHVVDGQTEKEIAALLYLSPDTVHSHMKAIFKVFGVNSRAALVSRFVDPVARSQI